MTEIEKRMYDSLIRTIQTSKQNKQRIIDFKEQNKIPISDNFKELLKQCDETIKTAEECAQRYKELKANEEEEDAYTVMMRNEIQD